MRILQCLLLLCILNSNSFAAESLLDVYWLALESDPELKQVEISYEIASEMKRQDLSSLLPSINISANTTDNSQKRSYNVSLFDGEEDYNSYGYSLTLKQSLFRYGNHVSFKQASDRINQADAEWIAAKQSLIVRTSERYFDVLAAQDNLRFVAAEKQAIKKQLEQVERRLNAGLSTITEVYEAKARLDSTIASEIEAQNQLSNSLESLRKMTDQYHVKLAPLKESIVMDSPDPVGAEKWETFALSDNLQVVALRHNNKLLRREIGKQRGGHYPELDLVAQYSKSISGGGNFGESETENRTVGLQLNMPIYQGGMVSSRTRTAIQQYNQNLAKMDATVRAVRGQAREAYLGVMASIARVQSLKQSVVSYQQAHKAIEAGYHAGMRTTFDVLQANRELYRAQRDYQRARYDYVLNGLRLKQSAGHLSLEDLKQVNLWLEQ